MMDKIEDQIRELKESERRVKNGEYVPILKMAERLGQAADTIESLSAKLTDMERSAEDCGGWIPVEERLPEDDTCVLAQVNGKHKNITFENAFEFATYMKGEGWTLETYPDWYKPDIVAWRELPEPYHEP